jgi:phosphatidylserine synthase
MAALRSARPWLRFVVVYGYVMTSIMILAAIGLLIYSFSDPRSFVIGLVYVLNGVLSLLFLTPLQQSSRALRTMTVGTVNASLEHFAQAQCRFWRMAGILSAITLALLAIVFAAAVLVGVLALARPGRP